MCNVYVSTHEYIIIHEYDKYFQRHIRSAKVQKKKKNNKKRKKEEEEKRRKKEDILKLCDKIVIKRNYYGSSIERKYGKY